MNYIFKSVDKRNGELLIDASNIMNGYFFAGIAQPLPSKKYKLRINKNNDMATYDLKNDGTFEIFPLQFDDGYYRINLYKNVYDNKYAIVGSIGLNVNLKDKNSQFLAPNQYINYHEIPEVRNITKQLCQGKTKKESYIIIKNFIKNNFVYDYIKAVKIKKGMLPDIKGTLKKRSGICLDIASLAVAMFRIIGVPSKLVIGMADNQYHAWVEIIDTNKIIRYDPTQEIYGIKKVNKYIPERYY